MSVYGTGLAGLRPAQKKAGRKPGLTDCPYPKGGKIQGSGSFQSIRSREVLVAQVVGNGLVVDVPGMDVQPVRQV